MKKIELTNIYYQANREVKEYLDIFFETNSGPLQVNVATMYFVAVVDYQTMIRLDVVDTLRKKYGPLYIEEARRTYDNDMYVLISGKFILVIEYVLNSNFKNSTQEFRIIEDLQTENKEEFESFKEMDIVIIL